MILAGCSEQSPSGLEQNTTLNPQCGKFGLSSMGKLEKRAAVTAVQAGSQVKFNLGKIKGSSGFFFLLYNVGMTPITNVSLSIENPAFSVFPSSMDTLIPGSDVGMLPVVKIAAFHGTPYDGVGNRPLLPKGQNEFVLHISGNSKTASGVDTVITLNAEMNLEALVMDMSIEGINGQLGFDGITNGIVLPDIDKSLRIQSNYNTSCKGDSNIILRNTGNVPLHCFVYKTNDMLLDSIISSGSNVSIALAAIGDCDLIVSGDNAVVDPERLILNDNGKFCAKIVLSTKTCPDAQVIDRYNAYLAAHDKDQCGKRWLLIDYSILIYGQNYYDSDSIVFVMYDLVNNEELTSFSGNSGGLNQDNCYQGSILLESKIISEMLYSPAGTKFGAINPDRISGGGQSNWEITSVVSINYCNNDN
jgi:hypothetical protein